MSYCFSVVLKNKVLALKINESIKNSTGISTIMQRKEDIKGLFFNHPTKQWHFEDLVKQASLTRTNTNLWLKRLIKEDLIKKIKSKEKMPYYIAQYKSQEFKSKKKMFALKQFEESGFLVHLGSLSAKTVIIFGSFSRADWHSESDIDLFVYGDTSNFEKGYFEKILKREIQVFNYKTKKDIKRLEPTVFPRIIAGIHVKGHGEPFRVTI